MAVASKEEGVAAHYFAEAWIPRQSGQRSKDTFTDPMFKFGERIPCSSLEKLREGPYLGISEELAK